MMMMQVTYSLDLMALSMGTALLVWSLKNPGKGSSISKLFGVIVMALSIIGLLCMFTCALRGECHKPMGEGPMMAVPAASGEVGHEPATPVLKKMEHKRGG